jgi:ABC-type antimicrobial peptide transport system permease subunit
MYIPRAQTANPRYFAWVAIRASSDPEALLPAVRSAVASLDPAIALDGVATMTDRLDAALAPDRFWASLVGALAGTALVLAALGIYGLVAFTVTRETRSIAIRMALGARAGDTAGRVIRRAVALTAAGLAVGLGLAALGRELIASFLVGVTPFDPATTLGAAAVLAIVSVLAAAGPAVRAARVDPVRVLRGE